MTLFPSKIILEATGGEDFNISSLEDTIQPVTFFLVCLHFQKKMFFTFSAVSGENKCLIWPLDGVIK